VTAALIPTAQTFAVGLGAALCGVVANAAGLAAGASRPVVAAAATALFALFVAVPLGAAVLAARLRPVASR
jgi:hypothetical protein